MWKRFCLFLFYVSVVTSPAQCSSQRVGVENRPYKSKMHERLPSFRMANLSLHFKSTWIRKEFGSNGKTTYRIHRASDWHSAKQRKTFLGAHAWRCRSKLGTARAHSLNSFSLRWPIGGSCLHVKPNASSATSQGGTRAPELAFRLCDARHRHNLLSVGCSGSPANKVTLCFPVFAELLNTQIFTDASTFFFF